MGVCGSSAKAGQDTKSYAPPKAGPQTKPGKASSKSLKNMSTDADFELLELVGKGAYGEVYKAEDKRTGDVVAIKRVKRSDIDRFVVEEVQNLSKCRHHQIIQFKEAYINDHHLAIVMEYANGGDLHAYVRRKGHLNEKEARWLYQQLITAVDYCHSQSIVNRDLKLENTLLVSTSRMPLIKICDFGVSKSSPMSAMYTKGIGTPGYTAPEVLIGGGGSYNGRLADVFSSGVILYIMVFGEHPFVDISEVGKGVFQNTHSRIARCQYTFPPTVPASSEVKDLLTRIFVADAKHRINIDDIFRHPWFVRDIPPGVLDRSYLNQGRFDQNAVKLNQIIRDANNAS